MTKQETIKLLAVVSGAYSNFQPNEMTPQIWHLVLQDEDFLQAQNALVKYIKLGNKFAPNPGELVVLAKEVRKEIRHTTQMKTLPHPEPIMDQVSRDKCVKMLRDVAANIAAKKVMP